MLTVAAVPYDFVFDPARTALVVIDMQRDFIEPGGYGAALGNDVTPLMSIIPTVERLLRTWRRLRLPIIHTREAHRPNLSDCPPSKRARGKHPTRIGDRGPMGRLLIDGEPGSAIVEALRPLPGEIDLAKPGKGAFYATPLEKILRDKNIAYLFFAGVTTEVCVQTSMREANDRGYECLLIADATASYVPEFKHTTLRMITAQGGIIGWVAVSEQVFTALEQIHG